MKLSSNVFKVAKFEIVRQLKKPAFWAATLLLPLLIGGIYFISFITSQDVDTNPDIKDDMKIAVTDRAGVLSENVPYLIEDGKEKGVEKVIDGEVDYYFYIPQDFLETKKVEFYHISEGLDIFNYDGNIIKSLLLQDAATRVQPEDVVALTGGFEVNDNKLTKDGKESNALGKALIPFAIGIVYFMFVALCGNRFLFSVVEEKENRISEIILTTVSSKHLIVGKIIAMLALALVQIAAFVLPVVVLIVIKHNDPMISSFLSIMEVDPVMIILGLVLFVSSAILYAGTCTFVGSLVPTAKDASSFIGPAIVAMVMPLYFMQMFMLAEPPFVVQFMTYFPLTAPIALMLRSGFGTISVLEYSIGIGVVLIFAIIMTRLAIISFQKNAINYGRASLKSVFKKN